MLAVVGAMVRVVSEPMVVNLPRVASMLPEMVALPDTSRATAGVESLIPILLFDASTNSVFEILAVIPDDDAISKNVSGDESPRPNLPLEAEEKIANIEVVAVLSQNSTSLEKEAPLLNSQNPVIVSLADLEAGPLI